MGLIQRGRSSGQRETYRCCNRGEWIRVTVRVVLDRVSQHQRVVVAHGGGGGRCNASKMGRVVLFVYLKESTELVKVQEVCAVGSRAGL